MQVKSLLIFCLFFTFALSLFTPNGPVVILNKDNFDKEVIQSKDIWIVIFFANWCGKEEVILITF